MAYTAAQICTRAIAQANGKGAPVAAGQYLNLALQELCQTYDFDVARGTATGQFNPSSTTTSSYPNNVAGSGPYNLPADYLRVDQDEAMWFLNGVPYPMIPCDLSEYDAKVQTAGMQDYPLIFATDLSASPPVFIVWPPSSGTMTYMFRYRRQMPDITSPETSSTVPWFPNQNYLITRVAGELMKESGDDRWRSFLGEDPSGAQGILKRYLDLANDKSDRAQTIKLDRRRFGPNFARLPNTKALYF